MAKDLFAPPSKEELVQANKDALFSAPTSDEIRSASLRQKKDSKAGSPLEAFIQKAGSEFPVVGSYLPQLQAMGAKAVDYFAKPSESPDVSYTELRDQAIKRGNQLAQDYPTATKAGMATGLGTGVAVLGGLGSLGATATVPQRITQGAKIGALFGAASNPGDTEGELNPIQLEARLMNAGIGYGLGGASSAAAEAAGPVLGWIADKFKGRAAEKAVKALGGTSAMKQKLQQRGGEQALGSQLLEENIIPVVGTPRRIAGRIKEAKQLAGKEIGSVIDSVDPNIKIDFKGLADDLSANLDRQAGVSGAENYGKIADKLLNTLKTNGEMSLKDTQAYRIKLDNQIDFASRGKTPIKQDILMAIRNRLNDEMDSVATQYGIGGLKEANRAFSNLGTAETMVRNKLSRDAANQSLSLTDIVAGGSGALFGDSPTERGTYATAAALLNKGRRAFGESASARSNQAMSRLFNRGAQMGSTLKQSPAGAAFVGNQFNAPKNVYVQDQIGGNQQDVVDFFRRDPKLIDQIPNKALQQQIRDLIKGKQGK